MAYALLGLVLLSGCATAGGGEPQFVAQGETQPSGLDPSPAASAPRTPSVSPNVSTRTVTELVAIPYPTRSVDDVTMNDGLRRVLTPGVAGTRQLTYRVTMAGSSQTARELIKSVVLKRPVSMVIAIGTKVAPNRHDDCNANYGDCVPIASDVDCAGGGNGPVYVQGPFQVIGIDIYHLDLNGDGRACDGAEDIP
jgi:resuscitation-promoting factor RpfB